MSRIAAVAVSVALAAIPGLGAAQDGSIEFVSAVPESPAFLFLGTKPTSVTRPGSLRDLGAALINGIDAEGKAVQGLAIEASPWTLIPGFSVSLQDYQKSWLKYVLSNASVSFATARASGDSSSTGVALGLRLVLLDGSDPMRSRDFTDLAAGRLARCLSDPGASEEKFAACADDAMASAYSDFEERTKKHWNAPQAAFGLATGWNLEASRFDQGRHAGLQAWLVGSRPVTAHGQIIAQATVTDRPEIADQSRVRLFTYGGRLVGGSATFNLFLEVVGETRRHTTDGSDRTSGAWSGGIELRLAQNLWLSTGFGSRFNTLPGADRVVVTADVRWAISRTARLDGLQPPRSER